MVDQLNIKIQQILDDDVSPTDSELREIPGDIYIEESTTQTPEQQINLLENTEKPHWEARAAEAEVEGKQKMATMLKYVADVAKLKADYIRLKNNEQPKSEEVLSMLDEEVENNPLTRFERFKKWAKENMGALSLAAISVAGIITTIAVSARGAVKVGAKATGAFAKGLWDLAKKFGPVVGGILILLGSILSAGATGLAFLANNLWILAVALTYYLYTRYKKKHIK